MRKIIVCFISLIILAFCILAVRWHIAGERLNAVIQSSANPQQQYRPAARVVPSSNEPIQIPEVAPAKLPDLSSLPPRNLKLVNVVGELKRLADEGNYYASCRLGFELGRCQFLDEGRKNLSKLKVQLEKLPEGSAEWHEVKKVVENVAGTQNRNEALCEGFKNEEHLEAWQYIFRAALAGHTQSQVVFAISPLWDPEDLNDNLDALRAFLTYRLEFLESAANKGDERALLNIIRENSGESLLPRLNISNFGGKPDFEKAAFYAYAYLQISRSNPQATNFGNRSLRKASQVLTSQQLATAKSRAEKLAATWSARKVNSAVPNQEETGGDIDGSCYIQN
ncbi:MAG: hypothetical protein K2Y28_09425 [Burkholderiaceae bacterium]|nr:hypothetical protein [Burkholderiaceae bacterium]